MENTEGIVCHGISQHGQDVRWEYDIKMRKEVETLLSLRPDTPPCVSCDQALNDLFAFATARGALLDSVYLGLDTHGGRGLFAARHIPAGGVVAVLPRSLRIGQKEACARVSIPSNTPDLTAVSLLLLSLLSDDLNPDDPAENWAVYAHTLPSRSEFRNAVVIDDEEAEAWASRGPEYARAVTNVRRMANCCSKYISDKLCVGINIEPNSCIYWAISMVLSRSHAFGSKGRWLTPVLDMANHCPAAKGGGELSCDDQGRLVLRAGRELEIGEEVTLDYQCEDDAQMVAVYGFSLLSSPLTTGDGSCN